MLDSEQHIEIEGFEGHREDMEGESASEMTEGMAHSMGSEVEPGTGKKKFDLQNKIEREMANERKIAAARKRLSSIQ